MSILVVGSVAFDSVETPFGMGDNVLGGSATYFSTSASFFTDVNLVAVVGEDFPRSISNLAAKPAAWGHRLQARGCTRATFVPSGQCL